MTVIPIAYEALEYEDLQRIITENSLERCATEYDAGVITEVEIDVVDDAYNYFTYELKALINEAKKLEADYLKLYVG